MARMGRPKIPLTLSDEEREVLGRYVRRGKTAQRLVMRARVVLECAKGLDSTVVATRLGVSNQTVCKWRGRFIADRLDGLLDAPRVGAPRKIGDDKVEEVVTTTLNTMPKGASRWSTRDLAKKTGLSHMAIARIWNAFGLKPHRAETFQLSADPQFIEKVRDVVGLYLDPPTNAVVLCVDEKSQIQALNRTQPILPMRPGQLERRTPEYERNGTTSLFAALDVATGGVIGRCFRRHRAKEFVQFLKLMNERVAAARDIHLIMDNYATHKAPPVRNWLARHRRFHLHFIPTHSSWLNQVECWFAILTNKQLKRGSHYSVQELEHAIREFLEAHNGDPKPFRWVKTADEILAKLARFCRETVGGKQ